MILRILVISFVFIAAGNKISENRFEDMAEFDPVAVTRCDIVCQNKVSSEKEQCHGHCIVAQGNKLGACPSSFDNVSIFAQACMDICSHDSQCPGIEKCCKHTCGITCQTAIDLNLVDGLPDIPTNVSARELRGPSLVELKWLKSDSNTVNKELLYLIEARFHLGRFYREESLGPWIAINQATKPPALVRGIIMPARWYLFRVAAVNINGTRGFSSPSRPFSLSRLPGKPGRPKRLGVRNVREVNGTVWGDLRWGRPKSDVPVRRYKIFWSCRLPGHPLKNASESVLVHQRSVPKSQLYFELKNLKKNELYFIQVQAMAVFGREKLKGAKAELFFNTTRFEDQMADKKKRKRPH